jgi:hypothetical protein
MAYRPSKDEKLVIARATDSLAACTKTSEELGKLYTSVNKLHTEN